MKWFAPILSFTTEEIYRLLFKNNKSIHFGKFLEFPGKLKNEKLNEKWKELIKIRDICNISIEEKRANKEIGSSLEAELKIEINESMKDLTQDIDFSEICITSKADIVYSKNKEIIAITSKAKGSKCTLCWKINENPCQRESCPKHS